MNLSALLFVAALAYLALVFFRPSEVIPGWEGVHLVLGASVVIAPLLVIAWRRRAALPIELPHDRLLLGFWLIIGASNVASGWWDGAVLGLERFAQVVFLYFVLRTTITSPERFRAAVAVLIAAMVFHAVGAIRQYVTGVGWGGVTIYTVGGSWRSRSVGIFHDPNDLALGFLLVLPFLAAGVCGRALPIGRRIIAGVAAIPLLVASYCANSRGAMLGLAASVCAYTWRRFGLARGAAIAVLALAALLLAAPSRVAALVDASEAGAAGRIGAWAAGLEMLRMSPLIGVGWERYTEYHVRPAHNSFMHAFAELGLIGGICFVAIAYAFFWGVSRGWGERDPAGERLANEQHALTSAGVGFFVAAFFLSKQYNVMTFTLVALGAVYLALLSRERGAPPERFDWRQQLFVAAAAGGILGILWLIVRLLAQSR